MKQVRQEARNPAGDQLWDAAKTRGRFRRSDLVDDTGFSASVVNDQVRRWRNNGLIVAVGREAGTEVLEIAPPIPAIQPAKGASTEDALWDAMRALGGFSPIDLVVALSVAQPEIGIRDARKYCQALTRAKYLKCTVKAPEGARVYSWSNVGGPGQITVAEAVDLVVAAKTKVKAGPTGWSRVTQAERDGRKVRWTILSRSEGTAKEAMEDALKPITRGFWAAYNEIARMAEPVFEEGEFYSHELDASYKTHEVRFPGGSRVTALSASPDAARGFGGNLLLDEFAFHRDSRRIWGSAFPVAARGGHKIRVISTPNGKGNKFYELMTAQDTRWSKHHVDIYEAVAQGLDVDIDELRSGMADEDAWAQEFELKWLDEASSWLDYDLIASVEDDSAGRPGQYTGGACYVGVDIAARNDLFVIWVLERVGGQLITREVIARKRVTFAEQDRLLDDVMTRYKVLRVAIDQTGMGEKPVEDAKRRHGEHVVDGVLFTAPRKLELASVLKEHMQDQAVLIPAGDPVLRADLHAIKSRVGATGIRRLVADGETDGHADRFWALALATGAAQAEPMDYAYTSARMPGARPLFGGAGDDDEDDWQPMSARGTW